MSGSGRSAAAFTAGAMLYRQAGYRVELVVLAVHAADSLQGTAERYARLSGHGAPARFTTAGGHDAHFAALPDTVRVFRPDASGSGPGRCGRCQDRELPMTAGRVVG
ncbi:zeta toxin family protein [Streptomyces achromogenes]